MADDWITTGLDLRRLVKESEAAGFNPLSVLRAGGAAGFMSQRNQYGITSVGGDFTPPAMGAPAPAPATPVPVSSSGLPTWAYIDGTSTLKSDNPAWAASQHGSSEDTYQGADSDTDLNIAIAQYRMRNPGQLITDQGRLVDTFAAAASPGRAGSASSSGSGMSAQGAGGQRTAAAPGTAYAADGKPGYTPGPPGRPYIDRDGFQPRQLWKPDELPAVVNASTWHMILPGVYWEETAGTRGETMETLYGDSWGDLAIAPKALNDVGLNFRRMWDHNMPTLPKVQDFFSEVAARGVPDAAPSNPGLGIGGMYYTGGGF